MGLLVLAQQKVLGHKAPLHKLQLRVLELPTKSQLQLKEQIKITQYPDRVKIEVNLTVRFFTLIEDLVKSIARNPVA